MTIEFISQAYRKSDVLELYLATLEKANKQWFAVRLTNTFSTYEFCSHRHIVVWINYVSDCEVRYYTLY